MQSVNRWDDLSVASLRSDLVADLWDHQRPMHSPHLRIDAPV